MKCPKCDYLGFETGDRCKNCGYNFSLLARRSASDPGLKSPARELPLFAPRGGGDDEPLVKLPAVPRAPLSVRKTSKTPERSPRSATPPRPRVVEEPVLQFTDETAPFIDLPLRETEGAAADPLVMTRTPPTSRHGRPGTAGRRLGAAVIDHAILLAIDGGIVYFTLRMADLPLSGWALLPPLPLLGFLGLVKFAYFCAFTAVGGQTIGKMAFAIRVVTDGDAAVDGARAIRRTIAGVAAYALGLGFIPALVAADGRAFHDRVARTRVIGLRSA